MIINVVTAIISTTKMVNSLPLKEGLALFDNYTKRQVCDPKSTGQGNSIVDCHCLSLHKRNVTVSNRHRITMFNVFFRDQIGILSNAKMTSVFIHELSTLTYLQRGRHISP